MNRLALTYSIYEGFIHSVLGLAADNGLVKTVKAMLAAGADVNFKDTWGGTALIDAAHRDAGTSSAFCSGPGRTRTSNVATVIPRRRSPARADLLSWRTSWREQ